MNLTFELIVKIAALLLLSSTCAYAHQETVDLGVITHLWHALTSVHHLVPLIMFLLLGLGMLIVIKKGWPKNH